MINPFFVSIPKISLIKEVKLFHEAGQDLGESALSETILRALHRFVVRQKSNDFWDMDIAKYVFQGATAVWHSLNLKDPGTYQLGFVGSPTHAGHGVSFNGSTQYATTGITLFNAYMLQDNTCCHCYLQSNVTSGATEQMPFGVNTAAANSGLFLVSRNASLQARWRVNANGSQAVNVDDSLALHTINRYLTANSSSFYLRGVELASPTGLSNSLTMSQIYLGCRNNNGTAANFMANTMSYWSGGLGRTDAQVTKEYTIIQALHTETSRNV